MVYHGRVRNGLVVLDLPAPLPEGAEVFLEVVEPRPNGEPPRKAIDVDLMSFAGRAKDLSEDASATIDKVLYERDV